MMLTAVFSSLVFMKRRSMMEIFPEKIRDIWKEWELRALVFISLISQLVLIIWGSRRKYNPNLWIAGLVWSAYLLADAVATMGLGVLLNNLGEIYEHHGCSIDANNELTAFWAPFFLLHLGGPDTITAYSLEDNELYLRHAFGLVFQTVATVYIILLAWNSGSDLSFLALPMTVVGCLKYGERTFTLFFANGDQLRDSMLTSPDAGPSYPKFMNEFSLKHSEGFHVEAQDVIAASHQVEISVPAVPEPDSTPEEHIRKADDLFKKFKCLFVDLILSFQDRDHSRYMFRKMSYGEAFNVIEIELGFMYDLLYTKATVIHTSWGLVRRIITTFLTFVVLVIFSCFVNRKKYTKIDLSITFLLLIIAIVLEIYAALFLLYSDRSTLWLNQHKKVTTWIKKIKNSTILKPTIGFLERMVKLKRWSNQIGQYSVTCLCLKEKHGLIGLIYKISRRLRYTQRLWEDYQYTTYKQVQDDLKKLVFEHASNMKPDEEPKEENREKPVSEHLSNKKSSEIEEESSAGDDKKNGHIKVVYSNWGSRILKNYGEDSLNWSVAAEFDKSILLWHIATTLCYYKNHPEKGSNPGKTKYRKFSKYLSRYMIYLLVVYPSLLPVGIGLIRFRDTCSETEKFVEERMPIYSSQTESSNETSSQENTSLSPRKKRRIEACRMLLGVKTYVPPNKVKGDRSKSVLFDACKLATELNEITDEKRKWNMITDVWLEILIYAASQGRGNQHARRLKRGGELLTHVWFLMAHFGMTDQFQISHGQGAAKLIVK
ncbi:hypothetical protein Patl1_24344 [Pistacia atlantica]|uniref:Uncharacterized protein n=1 Tax=Pistacia atlantica TaxID=434234 RepID=A0ACC1A0C1_9ROSI|nr:hypothetical protein Patl1_24344 [Pistacia atlantica]